MKIRGFSLLEIVVVIALVGVLVAFAVPTYKSYITETRVASVLPLMQHYAQIGQEYFEANAEFGDAAALGLNTVVGQDNTIANPQTINRYTSAQIVDIDLTALCYNNIRFTIDGSAVGIANNFDIQMVVRYVNGEYQISCGIPWDENSTTYANFLDYFPASCSNQNVSSC